MTYHGAAQMDGGQSKAEFIVLQGLSDCNWHAQHVQLHMAALYTAKSSELT